METEIFWEGIAHTSVESCHINTTEVGSEITSASVGTRGKITYHVEYVIRTNANWETTFFAVGYSINKKIYEFSYEADGKGKWFLDKKEQPQFDNCIDIDISLTPFTNSLPINRLHLAIGEERGIKVLYLDLLKKQFTAVEQKYRRISATRYHYENVPNDFEADITVDAQGFVVDYPSLFVRTKR